MNVENELPISKVHPSWLPFFAEQEELLIQVFSSIDKANVAPHYERIFRAFEEPLDSFRVVIFGQDPYPGEGVADGLAFSSSPGNAIPASLRNIFKEYQSDLGFNQPSTPDLTPWSTSGVFLLNRTLTTVPGERNAHLQKGWRTFTYEVTKLLGERGVVAILWGNYARELSPLFARRIESVHPSPLSARLGFFGSRPFSGANQLLQANGLREIDWRL
jgi:uracil-DNA glycosylase